MVQINYSQLLDALPEVARDAGHEIMKIYDNSIEVNFKDDGSPVTLADEAIRANHTKKTKRNHS